MSARTVPVSELVAGSISAWRNATSKKPTPVTISGALGTIKSGHYHEEVFFVRDCILLGGADELAKAKQKLHALTWSGTFTGRGATGLEKHSGLAGIDFDKVPDTDQLKARLAKDRHVLAAWISASGRGVHALVACEPTDRHGHKKLYVELAAYFTCETGQKVDSSCSDVSRLLFVSHDPDMFVREGEVQVFGGESATTACPLILSQLSQSLNPSESSTCSTPSTYSTSQLSNRVRECARLEADLRTHHEGRWARLYGQFIEGRTARAGERNKWLVATIPAIYCVVAEEVAMRLCLHFYDMNAAVFGTSRAEHEKEVRAMVDTRAKSYEAELAAAEDVYQELDDRRRATFRICRDLAIRSAKKGGAAIFSMSANELGARLNCHSQEAHRILIRFASWGIINMEKLGTRRMAGVAGAATTWRWLLPVPAVSGGAGD